MTFEVTFVMICPHFWLFNKHHTYGGRAHKNLELQLNESSAMVLRKVPKSLVLGARNMAFSLHFLRQLWMLILKLSIIRAI